MERKYVNPQGFCALALVLLMGCAAEPVCTEDRMKVGDQCVEVFELKPSIDPGPVAKPDPAPVKSKHGRKAKSHKRVRKASCSS